MKHFFSKMKSRQTQRDEGDVDAQPKTLAGVMEATKEHKVNLARVRNQTWDCVTLDSSYKDSWALTLNTWADLAYQGKWEELLKMGTETPVLINSRRLQKRIGPGAQGRPPGGYTALHQAAWHGAPVEIVQALINLGANRMYPISTIHLTTNQS